MVIYFKKFRFQRLIEMSIYFCRKSNPSKESTHQIEAAMNQIKARKIFRNTKIPVMA